MVSRKLRFIMPLVLLFSLVYSAAVLAETWRFNKGKDWQSVSQDGQNKYVFDVAQIKKLVNEGRSEEVSKALNKLKIDYPDIAGPDLDIFIKAEILFSEEKFVKAVRAYDELLEKYPSSALYEAALEREHNIATAFLAGRKKPVLKIFKMKGYAEGAKVMERISDRGGDSPVAVKSLVSIAQSYENRGKFNDAYHQWSYISSKWPTGRIGNESLLAMGRCKHAAYREPRYDGSSLISAKSYYENFKLRYPEDARKYELGKRIAQIDEQIAYKQFTIGSYYQKTGSFESSQIYNQMVIDNWPESTAARMAKAAMANKKSDDKEGKKWKEKFWNKFEKLFL